MRYTAHAWSSHKDWVPSGSIVCWSLFLLLICSKTKWRRVKLRRDRCAHKHADTTQHTSPLLLLHQLQLNEHEQQRTKKFIIFDFDSLYGVCVSVREILQRQSLYRQKKKCDFFPSFAFHNEYVGRRRSYTPKITQLELVLSLSNFVAVAVVVSHSIRRYSVFGHVVVVIILSCSRERAHRTFSRVSMPVSPSLVLWQLNRTN